MKTRRSVKLPRIGPCRDPLRLWFLEFADGGRVFRKYFAARADARRALRTMRDLARAFPGVAAHVRRELAHAIGRERAVDQKGRRRRSS